MPIIIGKNGKLKGKTRPTYNARFFDIGSSLEITGSGGKAGLLNEMRNPSKLPKDAPTNCQDPDARKRRERSRTLERHFVPLSILPAKVRSRCTAVPLDRHMTHLLAKSPTHDQELLMRVSAHMITTDRDLTPIVGGGKHPINCRITYRLDLFASAVGNTDTTALYMASHETQPAIALARTYESYMYSTGTATQPMSTSRYTDNVAKTIRKTALALEQAGWHVDMPDLDRYIDGLSAYDLVCAQSTEWNTNIPNTVMLFVNSCLERAGKPNPTDVLEASDLDPIDGALLADTIARLESWPVPLGQYTDLYDALKPKVEAQLLKSLCRENLNIMFSDLIEDLRRDSSNLATIPDDPTVTIDPTEFNADQIASIKDRDPLVMVPSAAGTGKTRTIMGRLDYMVDLGIDPDDILVATFTNVAADEVKARNRKTMEQKLGVGCTKLVKSMTIDSLVFAIYHEKWPGQALTASLTLGNALEVYFPNDPDATLMRNMLSQINDNMPGALTRMSRFVEDNLDHVIEMLEEVNLVTLELADIICYHMIESLDIPDEVAAHHVIMDEVQDTSVIQFIFMIRYVSKMSASLFMVGK